MKTLLLSVCLLLPLVTITKANNVNLKVPFVGAELSDSSSPTSVILKLSVNLAEPGESEQIALDDFETLDCFAIDAGKKIQGMLSIIQGDKLHPICTIGVSEMPSSSKLRADWSKFGLEIGYRFRKDGAFTPRQVFKGINSITRCLRVSDVTATLGSASRTGPSEISVPISLNADIRLNVELRKQSGGTVATPSGKLNETTVLFAKDDNTKVVKLKLIEDILFQSGPVYKVWITQLSSQPPLAIEISGDDSFTVPNFSAYVVSGVKPEIQDDGSVKVTFSTSTSGSVTTLLNGGGDPIFKTDSNPGGPREFIIPADKVPSGANVLTFSGSAQNTNLPLTGEVSKSFAKPGVTFLKETPVVFTFDEASGDLKIQFALSSSMNIRWQFKERNGLGEKVREIDIAKNLFEATINLKTLAPQNKELVESKLSDLANTVYKKAPVAIEIVNANKDTEIIASFELNFIQPKKDVIDKVKEIEQKIADNKLKDAKALIAQLLDFGSNLDNLTEAQKDTIDGVLPQVRNAPSTKDKVFKILGFAGKITAGFFGIPLPF